MSSSFRAASKRKKKTPSELAAAARWLLAFCGTIYLSFLILFPQSSGTIGGEIGLNVFSALGGAAYVLPPLLLYGLLLYFRTKAPGFITWGAGSVLVVCSATTLLAAVSRLTGGKGGGVAGAALYDFISGGLGGAGAWLIATALGLLGLQALFEVSWGRLTVNIAKYLVADYKNWLQARRELNEQLKTAAGRFTPVSAPAAQRAGAPAPAVQEPPASTPVYKAPPVIERKEAKPGKPAPSPAVAPPPDAESFVLPSLDLLAPKQANHGRGPSEQEIQTSVESLDRTLASFEIDAKVSGVLPGPVITRYEVSPGPGVTVSSIKARENDIALAMKARGIRMIAPIPGKAAIGIEIPNQDPAGVGLREVLESQALASHRRPLAFALGLSSDGTPLATDLQSLPHLLIAGATNSGKSVMMHALIQSILFRATPSQVKFLMIDPKRIELSLYEGIPHLYDPKTPCEQVGVITHSKSAARSLKSLITVMESRYEKFQAYKVRDIEGFNAQARKQGHPPEFYIVVVIDELADLMVVAGDVVEDSIQRLAQMARAVGIHLVLATQRPSVDVITGVIKANLPARLALRVASKVDSKVILDTQGAESLLGKGDTLYLAPGQDPVRVQGCYVSTDEIGKVVEYLKTQGKPNYAVIGGLAEVGNEDLSRFGVEPQEFLQALQLVMERRRVSQDLLKSQFGSSARATNILSLLEIKKFIHKPEGTNRWEIHFDQIEDYLKSRISGYKPES